MAKQSSFPQQSTASLRNRSRRHSKRRNALKRTSNHSASRSGFRSQHNSEASTCRKVRRGKLPLDLSQFVSDPRDDSTIGGLCDRCRRINFEAIFNVRSQDIGLHGTPVFELGSIVSEERLADCSLCALFASAAFGPLGGEAWRSPLPNNGGDLWHLRLFSALQMLRLKHTKHRLNLCRSKVLSVVHTSAEYAHFGGRRWLSQNYEAFLNREVIVPVYSQSRTPIRLSQQWQGQRSRNAIISGRVFEYQGRLLKANEIEYSILQEWIDECHEHHFYCTDFYSDIQDGDLPPAKRLIDCGKRKNDKYEIVLSTAGMQYFTLSYVWGPDRYNKNMQARKFGSRWVLPANLPASIADAITLVQKLGYRYLWVDQYCIDQRSGSPEKVEQIGRMDEIYEAAVATIIATGPNANSGLPGVSRRARNSQPVAVLHNMTLISTSPNQSPLLEPSQWRHRGWTLQEYLLSRRCLIFTDTQIYFMCRQSHEAEGIIKSPDVKKIRKTDHEPSGTFLGPDLFQMSSRGIGRFAATSWPLLDLQLQEYTSRDLTFASDSLDAFRGILKRSRHKTYWGIPIFLEKKIKWMGRFQPGTSDDINLGFAYGLIWAPSSQIRYDYGAKQTISSASLSNIGKPSVREFAAEEIDDKFPSWSWTSSRESTAFLTAWKDEEYLVYDIQKPSEISPIFSVEDHHGSIRPLQDVADLCQQNRNEWIIPEQTRYLHLQCKIATCMILCDDKNTPWGIHESGLLSPTNPLYVHNPTDNPEGTPGFTFDAFLDDEVFRREVRKKKRGEPWDLISLPYPWWMLIYWDNNTAYRVGIIKLSYYGPDYRELSLKQKTIRLG
jgi:Heterokaryon incompatibility protein (HET)